MAKKIKNLKCVLCILKNDLFGMRHAHIKRNAKVAGCPVHGPVVRRMVGQARDCVFNS